MSVIWVESYPDAKSCADSSRLDALLSCSENLLMLEQRSSRLHPFKLVLIYRVFVSTMALICSSAFRAWFKSGLNRSAASHSAISSCSWPGV